MAIPARRFALAVAIAAVSALDLHVTAQEALLYPASPTLMAPSRAPPPQVIAPGRDIREGDPVTVVGRVARTRADDILLDVNGETIRVTTGRMRRNPVSDDDGLQLQTDDRIQVEGRIADIRLDRIREIEARAVTLWLGAQAGRTDR